ncbi:MAG: hypothetical protein AMXMBFR55_32790 [Gemmatimonadota bacterium]
MCVSPSPAFRLPAPVRYDAERIDDAFARGVPNVGGMSTPSRSAGDRHPRRPPSSGFTLVEVVVAVALLALAALGVASTATFVARLAASARAIAAATRATASVVDSLRSAPCSSLAAGSAATAAGTVRWTTTAAGATRQLHAFLTPGSARVHAPLVEEAIIPCS